MIRRMGRPPRHDTEGAWHHLMNRGADRQDIFSDDDDRVIFEHHTGELVRRGLLEIHTYVLMHNHFHLLVRSPAGQLSEAMHRLGCEYARWYNRRHGRDGPLFRNRFVSVPVTDDDHVRWSPFRASPDPGQLERAVAATFGSVPTSAGSDRRPHPDAFVLLVALAVELRTETAEQIARRYGLPSAAAVRALARRGRVRLADDAGFEALRTRTLGRLAAPRAA
jgi:REP element-mobilizing transposase RayT